MNETQREIETLTHLALKAESEEVRLREIIKRIEEEIAADVSILALKIKIMALEAERRE